MQEAIKKAADLFLEKIKNKDVKVISHYDTDGITSAAIISKTLRKLNKKFSVKIVKQLDKEVIQNLNSSEVLIFLDLGSSLLEEIGNLNTEIFIIDHHEISSQKKENTTIINPHLFNEEDISGAGLSYLFSKAINPENKEFANLAIMGMVGDTLDKEVSRLNNSIIEDSEVIIKKGLMLYPATRPIHKALEFSSSFFIQGVTGNAMGAISMLRDIGIEKENGMYKSLIDLNEDEMSKLVTAVLMRTDIAPEKIIGNLYLIKFFNKLEDARELSAMINACSRLGFSETSLALCLDSKKARKNAETIYAEYKQQLVSAINYAEQNKVLGKGYVILNAQDKIRDTIIGTVASILSMSRQFEEGTVILAMSYDKDKVKASARIAGRNGRNVRELLKSVIDTIGGECGGHPMAAGCFFSKEKESQFLELVNKSLEMEVVKL